MAKFTNCCRFCGYCRIPEGQKMFGVCVEEHGPRNARGEPGRQVPLLNGVCEHFIRKDYLQHNQARRRRLERAEVEEIQDVLAKE